MTSIQQILLNFHNVPQTYSVNSPARISPFSPNSTNISFGDGFNSNPINELFPSKQEIEQSAKLNPRIQEIAKKYGFKIKANDSLPALQKGHMLQSRVLVAKICSSLPQELKNQVNSSDVQQAAMLHDYGKVLIPEKVLNKKGKLNNSEYEIMKQHSEIGYELLKNKGLNKNVLNLIKYHHQNKEGTGYPDFENGYNYNLGLEILEVADKYSALVEKREYKAPMSKEDALKIIYEDVEKGEVSEEVFETLKKIV